MADLGAIGNLYTTASGFNVNNFSINDYWGGIYQVSGIIAQNSIVGISKIIAISNLTKKIVGESYSNELGEFVINNLEDIPHTVVGIDMSGQWASDATTVIPKDISWSQLAQSGLNNDSNPETTLTTNTAELTSGALSFNNIASNFGHPEGQWYAELEITNLVGNVGVGVATSNVFNDALGEDVDEASIGWYSNGDIKVGNVVIDTILGYTTGDTLRIYYDASNSKVFFGRVRAGVELLFSDIENDASPNHTFNTGTKKFVAINLVSIGDEVQFNTLGSSQAYSSFGFIPWDARDN